MKRSARGVKGTLLSLNDGEVVFRVKADNVDGFIDYQVYNYDLDVTITDEDAYIDDTLEIIDYSDETLGYK